MTTGISRRVLLIAAAGVLVLSGCGRASPEPLSARLPPVSREATPTSEPTIASTQAATVETPPGDALPPIPGVESSGRPIQTLAFALNDYATDVGGDGSPTRRGQGSESAIVSLPPGESFYVTFSVTLNFGIIQIVWSSVSDSAEATASGTGRGAFNSPASNASGTAQIALDDGAIQIGPIKTAIALQILSNDSATRWTLRFSPAKRQ